MTAAVHQHDRINSDPPLEAEYPNVACAPRLPTSSPAVDAVTMHREGAAAVAWASSKGANLAISVPCAIMATLTDERWRKHS